MSCKFILLKGKNAGNSCGKNVKKNEEYCPPHFKKINETEEKIEEPVVEEPVVVGTIPKCKFTFVKGQKKGLSCGKTIKSGAVVCSLHKKHEAKYKVDIVKVQEVIEEDIMKHVSSEMWDTLFQRNEKFIGDDVWLKHFEKNYEFDENRNCYVYNSLKHSRKFEQYLLDNTKTFLRINGPTSIIVSDSNHNELKLWIHPKFPLFYNSTHRLLFKSPSNLTIVGRYKGFNQPVCAIDVETLMRTNDYIRDNGLGVKIEDIINMNLVTSDGLDWLKTGDVSQDEYKIIETEYSDDFIIKELGLTEGQVKEISSLKDYRTDLKKITLQDILKKFEEIEDMSEYDLKIMREQIVAEDFRISNLNYFNKKQTEDIRKFLISDEIENCKNARIHREELKKIYESFGYNNEIDGCSDDDDNDLEKKINDDMESIFPTKHLQPKQRVYIQYGDIDEVLKAIFIDMNADAEQ